MLELYNAQSRQVDAQLEFYFTGTPTVIDKSNYLISFNLLEELGSDSEANPVGEVSANELDIKLYNDKGIFSPSNPSSPYYGLMRKGVKVVAKVRASANSDWDDFGTFYVNDWYAEVTGLQASVSCYDNMHAIMNSNIPVLPVVRDATYVDAFDSFLQALGVPHLIDRSIAGSMPWWYTQATSNKTLKDLSSACLAATFCDRSGGVRVLDTSAVRQVKATLTDGDQIISASVPQSISKDFDGLNVVINSAQLSEVETVLDIKEHRTGTGIAKSGSVAFNKRPVAWLECVSINANSALVDLLSFKYSADSLEFTTRNDGVEPVNTAVSAFGRYVETVKTIYDQYGSSPLTFDNAYAQTETAVARVNKVLGRYVLSPLPNLNLAIRGNPKLHLGDKITVKSARYNLLFTGILQRASYTYDGALHCDINLVDSSILEVS